MGSVESSNSLRSGGSPNPMDRVALYRSVVVEMEEYEAETLTQPGWCELTTYWIQSFFAVFLELPLRCVYHMVLAILWMLVVFVTIGNWIWARDHWSHHTCIIFLYFAFARRLLTDMFTRPCHLKWHLFAASNDVARPPAPPGASAISVTRHKKKRSHIVVLLCNSCIGDDTTFDHARWHFSVFSHLEACHPAILCGECCGCWDSNNVLRDRQRDIVRYARDQRTKQFYNERFQCDSYEQLEARRVSMTSSSSSPTVTRQPTVDSAVGHLDVSLLERVEETSEGSLVRSSLHGHGPRRQVAARGAAIMIHDGRGGADTHGGRASGQDNSAPALQLAHRPPSRRPSNSDSVASSAAAAGYNDGDGDERDAGYTDADLDGADEMISMGLIRAASGLVANVAEWFGVTSPQSQRHQRHQRDDAGHPTATQESLV